jgi:hypothetical protein
MKIVAHAVRSRLQVIALSFCGPSQFGFIAKQQAATAVKEIMLFIKQRLGLVLFLDLEKAYDTVNTTALMAFLRILHFPESLCNIAQHLFNTSDGRFCDGARVGLSTFAISRGVKQGDPSSCLFFNFFYAIISKLSLHNIIFADDTTLCRASVEEMQSANMETRELLASLQLRVSPKSVIMSLQPLTPEERTSLPYPLVNQYKHLGVLVGDTVTAEQAYEKKICEIEFFSRSFNMRVKTDVFSRARIFNTYMYAKLNHIAVQYPPRHP